PVEPQGQGSGVPSPWKVPGSTAAPSPPASGTIPSGPPSDPGTGKPPSTLQGSLPPVGPKTPQPITRPVLGNRDFVITITCYSDHVVVAPGGRHFTWKQGNDAAIDQAVAQNIQDLIAGRQKFVLPGEPPYRPSIRFLLAPGGLI